MESVHAQPIWETRVYFAESKELLVENDSDLKENAASNISTSAELQSSDTNSTAPKFFNTNFYNNRYSDSINDTRHFVEAIMFEAIFVLNREGESRPYFGVGGGAMVLKAGRSSINVASATTAVFGLYDQVTDKLGAYAEYRAIQSSSLEDNDNVLGTKAFVQLGVNYRF